MWKAVFLDYFEDGMATARKKSRKSQQNSKKELKGRHYSFGLREVITPDLNNNYV